jgi:hypothetical protein
MKDVFFCCNKLDSEYRLRNVIRDEWYPIMWESLIVPQSFPAGWGWSFLRIMVYQAIALREYSQLTTYRQLLYKCLNLGEFLGLCTIELQCVMLRHSLIQEFRLPILPIQNLRFLSNMMSYGVYLKVWDPYESHLQSGYISWLLQSFINAGWYW